MGHAIQLNFDKNSTSKIKKLWTSLKYHNICDFMVDNQVEPHMTLFVFKEPLGEKEDAIKTLMNGYFDAVEPFTIDISSIGVLVNDANIVILNLLITERLLAVHSGLYEKLDQAGYSDLVIDKCRPDKWMPYITMTMNTNETDMIDAIKLIKRKFKPLKASMASASLLSFYPIDYKLTKELG